AQLAAELPAGLAVLVGIAEPLAGPAQHPNLHTALALVEPGGWRMLARKRLLPSYDVFDERRYFLPGDAPAVLELERNGRRWRFGLTICEDLWVEEELQGHRLAGPDPVAELQEQRIDALLNLSASPFGQGKLALRQRLAACAAVRLAAPVLYVNQVGGNDELVFDGASFVVDASGTPLLQLPCCAERIELWQLPAQNPAAQAGFAQRRAGEPTPVLRAEPEAEEQLLRALVLGLRDYAAKCGFSRVLLGLSGGIDSALVAVIAAAALGAERVSALLLPSPYSSAGSLSDATALAESLGIRHHTLPISALMQAYDQALTPVLEGAPSGLTAENIQSRIRGSLLMAVANQQGQLLLATGNKSELAVGYCTLYGDMNGGLAVIGDLYKSTVFTLCAWLDSVAAGPCRADLGLPAAGDLIGTAIRTKPPSAELQPDQRDSDSLPDYAVLDPLLMASIEGLASPEQLIAAGAAPEQAERVHQLLRRAEFKRRQAAPVLKVSGRSFGGGWRMPIAAAH
ncbi:MAG: NAD+ synthase, partial [Cyanobacteriota bacterium]